MKNPSLQKCYSHPNKLLSLLHINCPIKYQTYYKIPTPHYPISHQPKLHFSPAKSSYKHLPLPLPTPQFLHHPLNNNLHLHNIPTSCLHFTAKETTQRRGIIILFDQRGSILLPTCTGPLATYSRPWRDTVYLAFPPPKNGVSLATLPVSSSDSASVRRREE